MKVFFSERVTGIDTTTFDPQGHSERGRTGQLTQIGDYPWGLLPHQIFLKRGETYTARVATTVCDFAKNCPVQALTWHFTITSIPGGGQGHTSIPLGGGRLSVGETQAITRSTVPVGPPVDGQP